MSQPHGDRHVCPRHISRAAHLWQWWKSKLKSVGDETAFIFALSMLPSALSEKVSLTKRRGPAA
jgi:hypothetical protein